MSFEALHYSRLPESYSRQLDNWVEEQEMPFGYEMPPPPADTNDYNQEVLNSKKEYPRKKGRAI